MQYELNHKCNKFLFIGWNVITICRLRIVKHVTPFPTQWHYVFLTQAYRCVMYVFNFRSFSSHQHSCHLNVDKCFTYWGIKLHKFAIWRMILPLQLMGCSQRSYLSILDNNGVRILSRPHHNFAFAQDCSNPIAIAQGLVQSVLH